MILYVQVCLFIFSVLSVHLCATLFTTMLYQPSAKFFLFFLETLGAGSTEGDSLFPHVYMVGRMVCPLIATDFNSRTHCCLKHNPTLLFSSEIIFPVTSKSFLDS